MACVGHWLSVEEALLVIERLLNVQCVRGGRAVGKSKFLISGARTVTAATVSALPSHSPAAAPVSGLRQDVHRPGGQEAGSGSGLGSGREEPVRRGRVESARGSRASSGDRRRSMQIRNGCSARE